MLTYDSDGRVLIVRQTSPPVTAPLTKQPLRYEMAEEVKLKKRLIIGQQVHKSKRLYGKDAEFFTKV